MTKQKYKKTGTKGFFDLELRIEEIKRSGDILQRISKEIDFEMFRDILEEHTLNQSKQSNVGAKPYDPVLMFKILILQQINGLSDDKMEFCIKDRLSFQQFLGLTVGDDVPDSKTIWLFREKITQSCLEEKLFHLFHNVLKNKGMIINEGKSVDASIVSVPKRRNSKEENDKIKTGEGDQLWKDNDKKKQQKDIDARWLKKNGETFYGYKDHTKIDDTSKFIDSYTVTTAAVHDSQALDDILDLEDSGQSLHADSAYTGADQEAIIEKYGMVNCVHEKGYKNKPLTEKQKENNSKKSKIRVRVEHVYGFISNTMSDFNSRLIGFERNRCVIGLINLTYNMFRYEQILRLGFKSTK